MSLEIVALPFLAMLIGLISLFMENQKQHKKALVSLVVIALIATCGLGINANIEAAEESEDQKLAIASLDSKNAQLITTISEFKFNTESSLSALLSKLDGWLVDPQNTSVDAIKTSVMANQSIEKDQLGFVFNNNTEIKYYVKQVDKQKVWNTLRGKGISVTKGEATLKDEKTNAIWFGGQVSLAEVKYVALTLMRAGISIQTIKPFSGQGRKVNAIEIGHDKAFSDANVLSVQQVVDADKFSR